MGRWPRLSFLCAVVALGDVINLLKNLSTMRVTGLNREKGSSERLEC